MPSSTPIIPEAADADKPNEDLEAFKVEMRALMRQMEEKISNLEQNVPTNFGQVIKDIQNEATVLEKVN